ncbi:MAG: tRNA pseudouridine(55) synthase TruB [Ignavibacteriales bacterium]|nr:tRNA pseudouridine(55) synthase TruB [Ignavibacteriales bacterium]
MINKTTTDLTEVDFEQGEVVLIDKMINRPSFHIIYKIRKTIGVKKVGHAGTLDPNATGLLIVCTGKKTKEIESFQNLEKTYTGTITLGSATKSMDSESEVIEQKSTDGISEEDIYKARDLFLGKINQTPPMYSAIKHKGKALYKYARKGIEVYRASREINVYKFEITQIDLPNIYFEINCSKGTYIRVLANDLGQVLGCGAYLSSLNRTRIGEYNVKDALTIDEFINLFKKNISIAPVMQINN